MSLRNIESKDAAPVVPLNMHPPKLTQDRYGHVMLSQNGSDNYLHQQSKHRSESVHVLAVCDKDGQESSYVDIYNSDVDGHQQAGIRMGKKNGGSYKDFVVDYADGDSRTIVLRITPGSGVTVYGSRENPVLSLRTGGVLSATHQARAHTSAGKAAMLYSHSLDSGSTVTMDATIIGRAAGGESLYARISGCFREADGKSRAVGDTQKHVSADCPEWIVRFMRDGTRVHIAVQACHGYDVEWHLSCVVGGIGSS